MTDRYAVIGNPMGHSKSPFIHTSFAKASGRNIAHAAIEGPLGQFTQAVAELRAAGAKGMNVTAPFKLDAFAYVTERSPAAELAGAANALKFDGERVLAENFEDVWLVRDAVHNLGQALRAKRLRKLGAGSAARGALLPFLAQQPGELVIANRNVDKAVKPGHIGSSRGNVHGCGYAPLLGEQFDLVFNATSASGQICAPDAANYEHRNAMGS